MPRQKLLKLTIQPRYLIFHKYQLALKNLNMVLDPHCLFSSRVSIARLKAQKRTNREHRIPHSLMLRNIDIVLRVVNIRVLLGSE